MKIRKFDMSLLRFPRPRRLVRPMMFVCGLCFGIIYLTASPVTRPHGVGVGGLHQPLKNTGKWSNDPDDVMYPPFVAESPPYGRGEYGRPVIVLPSHLSAEAKQTFDEGFKKNSFNQFVSDIVSVTRRLPDPGPPQCRSLSHQSRHRASVIMCFHNEAWSTLLRSVHSIINRSPPHLLQEIILVDDASDLDHLGAALEKYMSGLSIVKILRTGQREGLTRARLFGYKHATASVLVFLDSHIECFPGWLEPLLDRIAENPHAVPYPTIESIKPDTLSVKPHVPLSVGTFSWTNLIFRWIGIHELHSKPARPQTAPIKSATMPGGLFAISRAYFTLLGAYDPGLDYWGGENIELSFKVWMCNGSVELLPCSHVGHIFHHNNPIHWPTPGSVRRNAARVAEVWMDDYKKFFYQTTGSDKVVVGDISERQELRRSLNCHNFEWYLKNVLPELPVPTDCLTVGEIRNAAYNNCIDSMGRHSLLPYMYTCGGKGYNQVICNNPVPVTSCIVILEDETAAMTTCKRHNMGCQDVVPVVLACDTSGNNMGDVPGVDAHSTSFIADTIDSIKLAGQRSIQT
ncbi:polypeptide N-acetylgalactosaminyltransferase 5-like [Haliotis rufescens]|uniref:polypeptide N-acetylgalactosaminyltransferase 5-like n=1 Tax=Haliotis rufescens TaxID=6454 RepID=UPI00201F2FD8|nr:polypeptide N-acetylgalactosaminyltransferase 5-like [Haliotis rufescens]